MAPLYLDEDVNVLLVALLRARNIEVTSTLEQSNLGKSDREQLDYCIRSERILLTHNRVDFEKLYSEVGIHFP
ncbi:MAG TPA: DUF5615 family PIN-like protein [Bacteroidota bacterium]|nr:DUF5615 family PIN-like protein [Bacteroidota bacterium]